MIFIFTDFGLEGPYIGQVKAAIQIAAPGTPVIDLFADVPAWDVQAAAYLLAAYSDRLPPGSVVLAVVDPGVGGDRPAVALLAGERWYVGPDNGLFEIVQRRFSKVERWQLEWRPEAVSASFHGRDLFAPVAAKLALGESPPGARRDAPVRPGAEWPDDSARIIYIDRFGNAITGLRADTLGDDARLIVAGATLSRARTFCDLPEGACFWYENANGLAEIAVNQGRAERVLSLAVGTKVGVD